MNPKPRRRTGADPDQPEIKRPKSGRRSKDEKNYGLLVRHYFKILLGLALCGILLAGIIHLLLPRSSEPTPWLVVLPDQETKEVWYSARSTKNEHSQNQSDFVRQWVNWATFQEDFLKAQTLPFGGPRSNVAIVQVSTWAVSRMDDEGHWVPWICLGAGNARSIDFQPSLEGDPCWFPLSQFLDALQQRAEEAPATEHDKRVVVLLDVIPFDPLIEWGTAIHQTPEGTAAQNTPAQIEQLWKRQRASESWKHLVLVVSHGGRHDVASSNDESTTAESTEDDEKTSAGTETASVSSPVTTLGGSLSQRNWQFPGTGKTIFHFEVENSLLGGRADDPNELTRIIRFQEFCLDLSQHIRRASQELSGNTNTSIPLILTHDRDDDFEIVKLSSEADSFEAATIRYAPHPIHQNSWKEFEQVRESWIHEEPTKLIHATAILMRLEQLWLQKQESSPEYIQLSRELNEWLGSSETTAFLPSSSIVEKHLASSPDELEALQADRAAWTEWLQQQKVQSERQAELAELEAKVAQTDPTDEAQVAEAQPLRAQIKELKETLKGLKEAQTSRRVSWQSSEWLPWLIWQESLQLSTQDKLSSIKCRQQIQTWLEQLKQGTSTQIPGANGLDYQEIHFLKMLHGSVDWDMPTSGKIVAAAIQCRDHSENMLARWNWYLAAQGQTKLLETFEQLEIERRWLEDRLFANDHEGVLKKLELLQNRQTKLQNDIQQQIVRWERRNRELYFLPLFHHLFVNNLRSMATTSLDPLRKLMQNDTADLATFRKAVDTFLENRGKLKNRENRVVFQALLVSPLISHQQREDIRKYFLNITPELAEPLRSPIVDSQGTLADKKQLEALEQPSASPSLQQSDYARLFSESVVRSGGVKPQVVSWHPYLDAMIQRSRAMTDFQWVRSDNYRGFVEAPAQAEVDRDTADSRLRAADWPAFVRLHRESTDRLRLERQLHDFWGDHHIHNMAAGSQLEPYFLRSANLIVERIAKRHSSSMIEQGEKREQLHQQIVEPFQAAWEQWKQWDIPGREEQLEGAELLGMTWDDSRFRHLSPLGDAKKLTYLASQAQQNRRSHQRFGMTASEPHSPSPIRLVAGHFQESLYFRGHLKLGPAIAVNRPAPPPLEQRAEIATRFRPHSVQPPALSIRRENPPTENLLLIVDCSLSMGDLASRSIRGEGQTTHLPKIDEAKQELKDFLTLMQSERRFHVEIWALGATNYYAYKNVNGKKVLLPRENPREKPPTEWADLEGCSKPYNNLTRIARRGLMTKKSIDGYQAKIDELQPHGMTPLYNAILKANATDSDSVFIVTDGVEFTIDMAQEHPQFYDVGYADRLNDLNKLPTRRFKVFQLDSLNKMGDIDDAKKVNPSIRDVSTRERDLKNAIGEQNYIKLSDSQYSQSLSASMIQQFSFPEFELSSEAQKDLPKIIVPHDLLPYRAGKNRSEAWASNAMWRNLPIQIAEVGVNSKQRLSIDRLYSNDRVQIRFDESDRQLRFVGPPAEERNRLKSAEHRWTTTGNQTVHVTFRLGEDAKEAPIFKFWNEHAEHRWYTARPARLALWIRFKDPRGPSTEWLLQDYTIWNRNNVVEAHFQGWKELRRRLEQVYELEISPDDWEFGLVAWPSLPAGTAGAPGGPQIRLEVPLSLTEAQLEPVEKMGTNRDLNCQWQVSAHQDDDLTWKIRVEVEGNDRPSNEFVVDLLDDEGRLLELNEARRYHSQDLLGPHWRRILSNA